MNIPQWLKAGLILLAALAVSLAIGLWLLDDEKPRKPEELPDQGQGSRVWTPRPP